LDPVRRRETDITRGRCANTQIQRNIPKRTLLGHSGVAGFGLYAGERIRKNEYIGEYKGEILSKDEADRRGSIYHYRSTNYLFKLNTGVCTTPRVMTRLLMKRPEQDVDSTLGGNKTRFINHSSDSKNINCGPHLLLYNTVTRLGMYATTNIEVGEELFFDYRLLRRSANREM